MQFVQRLFYQCYLFQIVPILLLLLQTRVTLIVHSYSIILSSSRYSDCGLSSLLLLYLRSGAVRTSVSDDLILALRAHVER